MGASEREREREREMGGGGGCCEIQRLPEECVCQAIAMTTPRDACRSEAVSTAFRAAAMSDDVWRRFLPPDYAEILARAVDRVEFDSMKQLYLSLCDPILIDGGKMSFHVDRETGAKCFMVPARELYIVWGETPHYWTWMHHPESRFSEVAELLNVCWLEIRGKIESRMLSKWTNYSAYLVFKVSGTSRGFDFPLQEASVSVGNHSSNLSVRLAEAENPQSIPPRMRQLPFLPRPRFVLNWLRRPNFPLDRPEDFQEPPHPNGPAAEPQEDPQEPDHDRRQDREEMGEDVREPNHDEHPARPQGERTMVGKPRTRADGWKEILLGEFCNEEGDDGEVGMALLEVKGGNWKSGLIVQGIEIRPTK